MGFPSRVLKPCFFTSSFRNLLRAAITTTGDCFLPFLRRPTLTAQWARPAIGAHWPREITPSFSNWANTVLPCPSSTRIKSRGSNMSEAHPVELALEVTIPLLCFLACAARDRHRPSRQHGILFERSPREGCRPLCSNCTRSGPPPIADSHRRRDRNFRKRRNIGLSCVLGS